MMKTLTQKSEIEKKLLELDKSVLVAALIDASFRDEITYSAIERLTSDKRKNVDRFKARLKEICNRMEFVSWKYTSQYANEVEDLLEDIKGGSDNSKMGLELLKLFFLADGSIIDQCDDSSGELGNVFRNTATELFNEYAKECDDKEFVSKLLYDLILKNDYGLRDGLTDNIDSFLPEKEIRFLVEKLWNKYRSNKNKDSFYSSELGLIENMANALKDPFLLEQVIKAKDSKNGDYDNFRMGKIWLKAGDSSKALEYLEKVDRSSSRYLNELNELLIEVYKKTGNTKEVKEIVWSEFSAYRSKENFEAVVKLEGKDQRENILENEIKKIKKESKLNNQSVEFLLEMKLTDEASDYVLQRSCDLNGDAYYSLPTWARNFEKNKNFMASVLIYRALLDSILERAYSKAYHHGVKYLKKLELISPKVVSWGKISNHDQYFKQVMDKHKRKSSFWAVYRGER